MGTMDFEQGKRKRRQNQRTYDIILDRRELLDFEFSFTDLNVSKLQRDLSSTENTKEIFEILRKLIEGRIFPLLYSYEKCCKSLKISKGVSCRDYRKYLFFTAEKVSEEDVPKIIERARSEMNVDEVIPVKIPEQVVLMFKEKFLSCDVDVIKERLLGADSDDDIIGVLFDLILEGVIPVFLPIKSEFDNLKSFNISLLVCNLFSDEQHD
jgi:hypothetical protein